MRHDAREVFLICVVTLLVGTAACVIVWAIALSSISNSEESHKSYNVCVKYHSPYRCTEDGM